MKTTTHTVDLQKPIPQYRVYVYYLNNTELFTEIMVMFPQLTNNFSRLLEPPVWSRLK